MAHGVSSTTFRQLMELVPRAIRMPRVAVALSGGVDSTALLRLLHEYFEKPENVLAITIDHGLRKESSEEANYVGKFASTLSIPHQIHKIQWNDLVEALPRSQLQTQARLRRYNLLGEVCENENVHSLYVGHNLGDQLETFLFRLGRGSGWNGLSGMPIVSPYPIPSYNKLRVVRPLLSIRKSDLKATCRRFNQNWVEDPSNDSEDFDRIRIRKSLESLTSTSPPDFEHNLALFQFHASEVQKELNDAAEVLQVKYAELTSHDTVKLQGAFIHDEMIYDELAVRVLTSIVHQVSRKQYPPRVSSIETLWYALKHQKLQKCMTVGGCLVRKQRNHYLIMSETIK